MGWCRGATGAAARWRGTTVLMPADEMIRAATWARADVQDCGMDPHVGRGLELARALFCLYYGMMVGRS